MRIGTAADVLAETRWSEATLVRRYTQGDFPKPIRAESSNRPGKKERVRRYWDMDEVSAYFEKLKAQRDQTAQQSA